jgi:hypothetical protein
MEWWQYILLAFMAFLIHGMFRDAAKKRVGKIPDEKLRVQMNRENKSRKARVYLDLVTSTLRPGESIRDYEEASRSGWSGESGLLVITTERLIYLGSRDGETIRINWDNNDPTKIMLERSTLTSNMWVNYGPAPEKFSISNDRAQRFVELAKSSCRTMPEPPTSKKIQSATPDKDPLEAMVERVKKRMEES